MGEGVRGAVDAILDVDRQFVAARRTAGGLAPQAYLDWRGVLLNERVDQGTFGAHERAHTYLHTRAMLLSRKCGRSLDVAEVADDEDDVPAAVAAATAEATRAVLPPAAAYEFTGMHHIFTEHTGKVTCVSFAPDSVDLLACASTDGTVSVCSVVPEPRVLRVLRGHAGAVHTMAWAQATQQLATGADDRTVRVWVARSGECVAVITCKSAVDAVAFHPLNANIILAAEARGRVCVVLANSSKETQQIKCAARVLAIAFDSIGNLYTGDEQGTLRAFRFNFGSGGYERKPAQVTHVCGGAAITSLAYHEGTERTGGLMQVVAANNRAYVVGVGRDMVRTMSVLAWYPIVQQRAATRVRGCFCPSLFTEPVCMVCGCEDGEVVLFDASKARDRALITRLQGHGGAVCGVAWNCDESLLASGDSTGMVILWKRVHMRSPDIAHT